LDWKLLWPPPKLRRRPASAEVELVARATNMESARKLVIFIGL
jgi:hypothetical protein